MADLRALLQALTPAVPLPEGVNTAIGTVGLDAAGDVLVYRRVGPVRRARCPTRR